MIKFKYKHYLEYRFHPIKDRKPTPFVQNVQNVVTTSIQQASPPSPEFSPTRESFDQIIKNFPPSSDNSESESEPETDTTERQAWSTDDSSDSDSDSSSDEK
jgi:hypothetical protein